MERSGASPKGTMDERRLKIEGRRLPATDDFLYVGGTASSLQGEGKLNRTHVFYSLFSVFFLSIFYFLSSIFCYAEPISSTDLINNAKQYDGKSVSYQGEVIGDVMVRGNNAWVNLNDTKNAIGIWLASGLTKEVSYTGSYKFKGDIIEVEGIFHRSCLEHGGDLDIHAKSIKLIKKGHEIEEFISPAKVNVVITFLIICLTLAVIYFIRLFYSKKK